MAMKLRIRVGIDTCVSVPLVVATDPNGQPVEQDQIYVPGEELPENVSPRIIAQFEEGDEHLRSLFEEVVDSAPEEAAPKKPATKSRAKSNPFETAA